MATINKFEELEIWQLAREYARRIWLLTCEPPFSKDYKLRDQINDAAGSSMDNIAEGFERGGKQEFINFLSISKGSCGESRSQLYRAYDRNYITKEILDELAAMSETIISKTANMINYLNKSEYRGLKFKDRI